jgi:hypothetical protein
MDEKGTRRPVTSRGSAPTGGWLVLGLVALATGLGVFAVWFQWGQTRRCLAFFGPVAARRIQSAARVELWTIAAEGDRLRAVERLDVSQAPGLVHLRRGLIEDVNYGWDERSDEPEQSRRPDHAGDHPVPPRRPHLPASAWDVAVAFCDLPPDAQPRLWQGELPPTAATILVFDLDAGGAMTVVGQPGRVPLGRLRPGLRTWVEDTKKRERAEEKPGF